MTQKITKAILPVAGLGTRFLPATKAQPKEMLPVYDTPAIQLIVQDAVEAGITDIIVVTGKDKRAIEDHFDKNPWLEQQLEAKGKFDKLKIVQDISNIANFSYVRQPEPKGDGDAILRARNFIGDEPAVVLFGDDLIFNPDGDNAVKQMLDIYEKTINPVIMLQKVEGPDISNYGVVDGDLNDSSGVFDIKGFVEKPDFQDAPSPYGVVGKYIITPEILDTLARAEADDRSGELRLANAFIQHLLEGGSIEGKILEGLRFDTGDKFGFLKATLYYYSKSGGDMNKVKDFLDSLS